MIINHQIISSLEVLETIYYRLSDICTALNLDYEASVQYIEHDAKRLRPLWAGGALWITKKSLIIWLAEPGLGKALSPEALQWINYQYQLQ
ncbi:MAG TPA: hypothetical protein PKE03_10290 [Bacteroidales bacterium]|nr:hypothetical protein [Bacteroidales bacterium]